MTRQNLLPFITDRLVNTPLLLSPTKAAIIHEVLQGRAVGDVPVSVDDGSKPEASRFTGSHRRTDGGYSIFRRAENVAVITVDGSLVNRGAWVGASSGLVSYEGLAAQFDAARNDPQIKAAIIDMNSHGGEATGMVAVAAKVRELAADMPVVAVVNDVAASAGYGIASGATEIVVSPTSFVGSIGVVMVHSDHSGELEQKGVAVTILQKGADKTHGNPFGPLSGAAKASLDKMMTVLYDQFLGTVEQGRGDRLNAAAARKTEAAVFIGQDAVDAGLADRIGTFDQVLAELQSTAPSGTKTEKVTMADTNQAPNAAGPTITQAQHDQAVANAKAEGAKEATTRIGAILNSPEAEGREATAKTLALDTDMSADAAAKVLATTPQIPAAGSAIPTPGQRAQGEPEMGGEQPQVEQPGADSGWGDVVAEINERFA